MALKLGELVAYLKADDTALTRTLKGVDGKLKQAGEKARGYAPVVGAAMAAGIGAGLLGGLDLQASQAKLKAQLGDPKVAEVAGRVAGKVYSRGFGASTDEAMSAVQAVISSHLASVDDRGALEALTVKVQAYATAWGTDVTEATKYVSAVMKSGLAKDATEALDLITVASQRVPAALREDILDAGEEYSQFFSTLGFSGSQAFALLVKGSEKGVYGIDKMGDAIKEFTIRSTDMSTASVAAYKAIGLDADTTANKILAGGKSAQDAYQSVVDGLLKIKDPAKQANTAIALFGTPLEDLNVSDIPEFLRSMQAAGGGLGDVAGAADEAGKAIEDTDKQKLEAFKRQVQQTLIQKLGEAIPHMEKMGQWAKDNSGLLLTLGGTLAGLVVTIYAVRGAIAAWNAVTLIWTGITKIATAAQWLWNAALAANPIGLIIIAVLALVAGIYLLWENSSSFRDFFIGVWDAIQAAVEFVVNWIVDGWTWLFDTIAAGAKLWWKTFSGFWTKVGNLGKEVFQWIIDKGASFVGWVKGLPKKVASAAKGLFDGIKNSFKSAINWIIDRWNNLSLTIGGGSIFGKEIPSITLNTPNIPRLAKGGIVPATPGGRLVVVGEGGQDEEIRPLPSGGGGASAAAPVTVDLRGEFKVRGQDLVLVLRERASVTRGGVVALVDG